MKRRAPHAFTLIEMVTVIAVIVILAGLVISVAGYVQRKGAVEKCNAQMKNYSMQLEAYKVDNGSAPQNVDTDTLDPRAHFSAMGGTSGTLYTSASRFLYSSLSGDYDPPTAPDGKPEDNNRVYYSPKRDEIYAERDAAGNITAIRYLQDPFGASFGYSTAAAAEERLYREQLRQNPAQARPANPKGFNPSFDLWSTGGATSSTQTGKWIKNWGN